MSPIEEKLVRANRMLQEANGILQEVSDDVQALFTDATQQFNKNEQAYPSIILRGYTTFQLIENASHVVVHVVLGDRQTNEPTYASDPDIREHIANSIDALLREAAGPLGASVSVIVVDPDQERSL